MNKTLYECYYVVGWDHMHSCYKMIVDRETDQMYYGVVLNSRFAVRKGDLNSVFKMKDRTYGTVYRVQVDGVNNEDAAKQKAKEIIYYHMLYFILKFKNNKEC